MIMVGNQASAGKVRIPVQYPPTPMRRACMHGLIECRDTSLPSGLKCFAYITNAKARTTARSGGLQTCRSSAPVAEVEVETGVQHTNTKKEVD